MRRNLHIVSVRPLLKHLSGVLFRVNNLPSMGPQTQVFKMILVFSQYA